MRLSGGFRPEVRLAGMHLDGQEHQQADRHIYAPAMPVFWAYASYAQVQTSNGQVRSGERTV
jgi:hypothetical protein